MIRRHTLLVLTLLTLALVGCGQVVMPTGRITTNGTAITLDTITSMQTTVPMNDAAIPPAARILVEQASIKTAQDAGLPVTNVRVVSVEEAVWPNAQLGCGGAPLDDNTPTPGYRIVIGIQGKNIEYHTDKSRIVRCDPPRP